VFPVLRISKDSLMVNKLKPQPDVREADSKCSLNLNIAATIRKMGDSMQAFGFNVPVLIDRERNMVAGHGATLACGAVRLERGADALSRSPYLSC
jgi:hypothetical protein